MPEKMNISRGWDEPACPYCGGEARLVEAVAIFPFNPQMGAHGRKYWHCPPCHAWVKAALNDQRPLGTLADPLLRSLREAVEIMIAALVAKKIAATSMSQADARIAATLWLGKEVKAHYNNAFFSPLAEVEECRDAIKLMEKFVPRPV